MPRLHLRPIPGAGPQHFLSRKAATAAPARTARGALQKQQIVVTAPPPGRTGTSQQPPPPHQPALHPEPLPTRPLCPAPGTDTAPSRPALAPHRAAPPAPPDLEASRHGVSVQGALTLRKILPQGPDWTPLRRQVLEGHVPTSSVQPRPPGPRRAAGSRRRRCLPAGTGRRGGADTRALTPPTASPSEGPWPGSRQRLQRLPGPSFLSSFQLSFLFPNTLLSLRLFICSPPRNKRLLRHRLASPTSGGPDAHSPRRLAPHPGG